MPIVGVHFATFATAVAMPAAVALMALRGTKRLRGTTLVAPCLWVALSAAALTIGSLLESRLAGISLSAFRFALATTTLCPMMAVLGAKRPQDGGWQWVVLTLWIVLVWPAAQAVLLPTGIQLELFAAWKLFLWGLIALGVLNYLPTKHWRAAILVAAGQILLLREHLWLPPAKNETTSHLVAVLSFLSAAALVAYSRAAASPLPTHHSLLTTYTSTWLNFRNQFGAFWALRVLGRINQTAQLRHWPLHLDWGGFALDDDRKLTDAQLAELDQTLDSMLRRFVQVDK